MFKQISSLQFGQFLLFFAAFTVLALVNSCTNRNKQDLLSVNICDTANAKYSNAVSVILTNSCNQQAGCHGTNSPGSVLLDNFQAVKDRASDILSRIQTGNMPKNNPKLDACSISKVESWINKGAQNN